MSAQMSPADAVFALLLAMACGAGLVVLRRMQRSIQQIRGVLATPTANAACTAAKEILTDVPPQPAQVAAPKSSPETKSGERESSEETLLIIAAAVAAYLGSGVRIRRARLVTTGGSSWAQQGRVSIQASHNLFRT